MMRWSPLHGDMQGMTSKGSVIPFGRVRIRLRAKFLVG